MDARMEGPVRRGPKRGQNGGSRSRKPLKWGREKTEGIRKIFAQNRIKIFTAEEK
jgi:hypothetical protein